MLKILFVAITFLLSATGALAQRPHPAIELSVNEPILDANKLAGQNLSSVQLVVEDRNDFLKSSPLSFLSITKRDFNAYAFWGSFTTVIPHPNAQQLTEALIQDPDFLASAMRRFIIEHHASKTNFFTVSKHNLERDAFNYRALLLEKKFQTELFSLKMHKTIQESLGAPLKIIHVLATPTHESEEQRFKMRVVIAFYQFEEQTFALGHFLLEAEKTFSRFIPKYTNIVSIIAQKKLPSRALKFISRVHRHGCQITYD